MQNFDIQWTVCSFEQLTTRQLYHLLKLRVEVFVVEQTCAYQEIDGHDLAVGAQHVLGYIDKTLIAYARVLPPGTSYDNYASIGRVIVTQSHRGNDIAKILMQRSMALSAQLWPQVAIKISAQQPLQSFYAQLGFEVASSAYLEDGIAHIAMIAHED